MIMINPGRQQIRRTINILFALRGHNIIGRTTTQLSKTLSATDKVIYQDLVVLADMGIVERVARDVYSWKLTETMENFSISPIAYDQ